MSDRGRGTSHRSAEAGTGLAPAIAAIVSASPPIWTAYVHASSNDPARVAGQSAAGTDSSGSPPPLDAPGNIGQHGGGGPVKRLAKRGLHGHPDRRLERLVPPHGRADSGRLGDRARYPERVA